MTKLKPRHNYSEIINLQLKMRELPEEEMMEENEPQRTEINVPVAVTGTRQTNVTMEVDEASYTNLPEVTVDPCPVGMMEEVDQESEEIPEVIQKTHTPQPIRESISRKRVRTYSRRRESSSESTERISEEETNKKKRVTASKKKATGKKHKAPKTVAKDGRKLVDVTNRIRDSKDRLLGYKPGTSNGTKKPIKKRTSSSTTSKELTP